MGIDLHVHTVCSDGALRPEEVAEKACQLGLEGFAVTDHDTVAGLEGARLAAARLGLIFVPGVELSTDWEDKDVHILGYFVDPDEERFRASLIWLQNTRLTRVQKMVAKLNAFGCPVSLERVKELARGESIGRVHVAQAIIEAGRAESIEDAFRRFIGRTAPCYVPRSRLSPFSAVRIIRRNGGAAVLAHPGLVGDDEIIFQLQRVGLVGLEAFYPQHTPEQEAHYLKLARQQNLVVTGGSDYHGVSGEAFDVLGARSAPKAVVRELFWRRGKR